MLLKGIKVIRLFTGFLFLLVMFGNGSCNATPEDSLWKGIRLDGFEKKSELSVYNKDNLFDYINGEAEIYFPFGFQFLYLQTYRGRETGAQMIMEAYDMGTPEGAKGIFGKYTQEGGAQIQGLGESAWTDNYIILFRYKRYFLRIWPDPSFEAEIKAGPKDLLSFSQALVVALKSN